MSSQNMKKVMVIAPSGPVPEIEFQSGIQVLKDRGFSVTVHPDVFRVHQFSAGSDEVRARAFWNAIDSDADIVWCARGGYGVARILPLLEAEWKKRSARRKKPFRSKKTLIGFSDITGLFSWAQKRLGMRVIHGPMPGVLKFSKLQFHHWDVLNSLIHQTDRLFYELTPVTDGASKKKLTGPIQGGNLCVLASLCGTDFQPQYKKSVLFLEEIDESAYRLDRLMNQLVQSGVCDGILGIVLGTFTGCMDRVPEVQSATGSKKPLRPVIPEAEVPSAVFREWGMKLRVPVWQGLPIGHGDGLFSLSIGQKIRIEKNQLKIEF